MLVDIIGKTLVGMLSFIGIMVLIFTMRRASSQSIHTGERDDYARVKKRSDYR